MYNVHWRASCLKFNSPKGVEAKKKRQKQLRSTKELWHPICLSVYGHPLRIMYIIISERINNEIHCTQTFELTKATCTKLVTSLGVYKTLWWWQLSQCMVPIFFQPTCKTSFSAWSWVTRVSSFDTIELTLFDRREAAFVSFSSSFLVPVETITSLIWSRFYNKRTDSDIQLYNVKEIWRVCYSELPEMTEWC